MVWNQTIWHPSELVTRDARIGTGLSAIWFGVPPVVIELFYIDKNGYVQELRGSHGSDTWVNGTIGSGYFKAVDTYSALSAQFQGKCGPRGQVGWVYYESDAGAQEAHWNYDKDSWSMGNLFTDHAPGSDFLTTQENEGSAIQAWRFYGVSKDLQLQEYVCSDCCANKSYTWQHGTLPLTNCVFGAGNS